MTDLWNAVQKTLVELKSTVDVGHTDTFLKEVTRNVTPAYAKWLEENEDPEICDGGTIGPGKHHVEKLIYHNLRIVSDLLEEGVPEEVALGLLPREIYTLLQKQKLSTHKHNKNIALLAHTLEDSE